MSSDQFGHKDQVDDDGNFQWRLLRRRQLLDRNITHARLGMECTMRADP